MAPKVFVLGDERYVFDGEKMLLSEAFAIKAASGMDLVPFQQGLATGDPASYQALIWYLRQKNGRPEDIHHVDFVMGDLKVEDVPEPDADPTIAADSSIAATSTSDSLPTTAT